MKNNFSRSNVNESTLDISNPLRSSFDLSHSTRVSLPLGVLMPCNFEPLLPTDVLSGGLEPQLQLEKIMTPSMGRTRLDTHTLVVNARRVNRDFVTLRGDNTGSKPHFDVYKLYSVILSFVLGSGYDQGLNFADLLDTDYSDTHGTIANKLISKAVVEYEEKLRDVAIDKKGFLRDFFAIERERLKTITFVDENNPQYIVDALFEIMKPYCGESSQMDMLGYPILTKYTQLGTILERFINYRTQELRGNVIADLNPEDIFTISDFDTSDPDSVIPIYENCKIVDETPLRVVYAAWYDYFRNFHVEKRANFLDPDTFGKTPIIEINDNFDFLHVLQLVLPKYRMYARDYLTTVQTEDKFRFVYSPIKQTADGVIGMYDIDDDFYQEILGVAFPDSRSGSYGDETNFPRPFFDTLGFSSVDGVKVLRNDLQTMRRSGMLEKWLARNYFYPDTYVGQMLARYQVTPSDVAIINAEYIGGNESFLNDEQITANVTTDSTPMGQRVLKADVSLKDNFTYASTDYCYLVSFVSLMPLVSYDAPNMHLHEITSADFPDPEFAEDTRVAIRTCDLLRGFDKSKDVIGYVPRYYQYRVHPDETHGRYLTDLRSYNWFRDWYNMNFTDFVKDGKYGEDFYSRDFTLNPYSLRVHVEPDAFLGLRIWNDICFGKINIQCQIQRPLPAAVEFI